MTLPEALYCMRTYFDNDDTLCEKCPFYRSEKVVIDGKELYKCKEQEAHELVYSTLNNDNLNNDKLYLNLSNKRVIKIGGSNNGKTEQLLHINGGTERTGVANDTKTRRDSERD